MVNRKQVSLTDQQIEFIQGMADKAGIRFSEMLRRLIDKLILDIRNQLPFNG